MECLSHHLTALVVVSFLSFAVSASFAATEDLGKGFFHHGVATPISNHRGTVATADGQGRDVVLLWLYDHRGCYALLMIDAETGKAEQIPIPFPNGGDAPYSSILSSGNKFYTHFGGNFCEFDPAKRAFTFFHKTSPMMAMSMTEDDQGVIWSASYPNSGLVSFDPKTREFKDYPSLNKENWAQYPRAVAADDAGWIYVGIGSTASQIVAFDPKTGKGKPMLPPLERGKGYSSLYRELDGKVYGQASPEAKEWYEFYKGEGRKIGKHDVKKPKPYITASQSLFHQAFPDGKRLKTCDLVEREMVVEDPKTKEVKKLHFDYTSEGAHIMGLAVAPDGTICGGTAFPMRFFSFNPKTDQWINRACLGQWNTVARQGDRFFAGAYGHGILLEWDPSREWVPTEEGKKGCNPLFLTQCPPTINRPHKLLAHPDGHTMVLAGTPGYGYTGGGLLFWDRTTRQRVLLEHTDIIPEHSTQALLALPNGKLLGGTTTAAGTGGEKKAKEAEMYIMDMATKKLDWHQVVFPGAQDYTDLCAGPGGLVFGFADRKRFFVFDPEKRKVVHEENIEAKYGSCISHQGPRVFVTSPEGAIYILFAKAIARLDPATFAITKLADTPVPIAAGGDILDGRIYFAGGSHVYSYKVDR